MFRIHSFGSVKKAAWKRTNHTLTHILIHASGMCLCARVKIKKTLLKWTLMHLYYTFVNTCTWFAGIQMTLCVHMQCRSHCATTTTKPLRQLAHTHNSHSHSYKHKHHRFQSLLFFALRNSKHMLRVHVSARVCMLRVVLLHFAVLLIEFQIKWY